MYDSAIVDTSKGFDDLIIYAYSIGVIHEYFNH